MDQPAAPPPSIPDGAPPPAPPTLPADLLLEIAARSDIVSVVRCAATAKPLRRAILDRLPALRAAATATASGGFDPALLRGISYTLDHTKADPVRVRVLHPIPATDPSLVRFDESPAFEPVASRDGLVVLRPLRLHSHYHYLDQGPLRVVNTLTGDVSVLPPVTIQDDRRPALLSVGHSFELLVADERLRTQIYSSRDASWSPVRAAPHLQRGSRTFHDSCPLVIGRTVHWLCDPEPLPAGWESSDREPHIVAMDVDTTQARVIHLPRGCITRMAASMSYRMLLLSASVDGKLLVVVSETQVISMWTMAPPSEGEPPRWSREVLMDKQDWGVHRPVTLEGFGQRSGTAVLYIGRVALVRLNLATKEAHVVFHRTEGASISQVCLHEINLSSVLQVMKPLS